MSDIPIKRALIAVYDKTGIVEFARALVDEFGIEIISTGGTARHLKDAGIPVTMVEQVTGFPEMLDGRVKTLHPKIHAAILADRDNPEHMRQLAEHGIQPIDMVVVNLYPFEKTVADPNCTFEQAIEMIDIGGPCMLRAAAKNHRHVLVVSLIPSYEDVLTNLRELKEGRGGDHSIVENRQQCALNSFLMTARYDMTVSHWLDSACDYVSLLRMHSARYGENPHQSGTVYITRGLPEATLLRGKPVGGSATEHDRRSRISFNNYADGDAALSLVKDLTREFLNNEPRASARAVVPPGGMPDSPSTAPTAKEPRASARAVVPPGGTSDSPSTPPTPKEPRASARAAAPPGGTPASQKPARFSPPEYNCDSWFLTWTTYGQWLPGDERGFVSRGRTMTGERTYRNVPGTEWSANEIDLQEAARERMLGKPVLLTARQARCAYEAIIDAAARHAVNLIALSVMANHVHVVCQGDQDGSSLMQLFKGNASFALGKSFKLDGSPRWFTKSGSKRHIKKGDDLSAVIAYVSEQERPLCAGSCEGEAFVPEAEGARAEARGSLDGAGVTGGCGVHTGGETARAEARGSLDAGGTAGGGGVQSDRSTARAEARGSLGYAVAFIKHTNPCGCAVGDDPIDTYRRAYLGDPIAAAGGVLCVNFPVTLAFAQAVMNSYGSWGKAAGAAFFKLDVWISPSFDDDAVKLITTPTEKRKWGAECRLLAVGDMSTPPDPNELDYKKITGGMLVQTRDLIGLNEEQWKVVTQRAPSESEMADLRLAWLICKHTKSNAITICRDGMLLGNGAGQMSRVKSCDLAIQLARENGHADKLKGAVAAGDAFFPVPDGPQKLIDAGITAIIHPGGSNRDAETVAVCDAAGVAMIVTGTRHFKH